MTNLCAIIRGSPQVLDKTIYKMQTTPIVIKDKNGKVKEEFPNINLTLGLDIAIRPEFVEGFLKEHQSFVPSKLNTPFHYGKWLIRELILLPFRLLGYKRSPNVPFDLKGKIEGSVTQGYSFMPVGVKKDVISPRGREWR